MSDNGNRPAHPVIGAPGAPEDYPGLTKREAFAMAAMQGMGLSDGGQFSMNDRERGHPEQCARYTAEMAVRYADALLAALDPTP